VIDKLNEIIEPAQSQMGDIIPFGIACFHFGIAMNPPFRFTGEKYIAELRKFLESIPNIEQISITDIDDVDQIPPQDIDEKIEDIHETRGVFPNWEFGEIGFTLHIPERIQRQILPSSEICTERFEVSINYCFDMPVTFIKPINPTEMCRPSDAVILVREFLDQQFINAKSEYIRFEVLGPSPFHADCYIQPDQDLDLNESGLGFRSEDVTAEAGYDELIFYYDAEMFENEKDAEDSIFHGLILELSFFYEIIQWRAIKIGKWEQIDEMLRDVLLIDRKKNAWDRFLEFVYYSGKKIKDLFIAIAIFERDLIFVKETMRRDYKDVYSERWSSHFKNFIDKEMKEDETYPTKELIQLLSYLEDKRTKNMELITMFISAIIGGGIGALITLLLTKN